MTKTSVTAFASAAVVPTPLLAQRVDVPQLSMLPPRVLQRTKTATSSGARRSTFYVGVSLARYRVWWIGFLLLHATCIGYFTLTTYIYWQLHDTFTGITLQTYQAMMPTRYFPFLAACHAAVAAGHAFFLLRMVFSSLLRRRFTFGRAGFRMPKRSIDGGVDDVTRAPSNLRANAVAALHAGATVWANVFGRRGVFGVESRYFDVLFVLRELFENVLQAGQAYRMSLYVPRVLLNRFYVGVIVVNCCASPLAQWLYASHPPRARLLCLVLDIALDFAASVAIPVALLVPYRATFAVTDDAFDYLLWYNDQWLVNTINECKLLFVNSWPDLAARLFFSASLLVALESVKSLLRKTSTTRVTASSIDTARSTASFSTAKLRDAAASTTTERQSSRWASAINISPTLWTLTPSIGRTHSSVTTSPPPRAVRDIGSGSAVASKSTIPVVAVASTRVSKPIAHVAHVVFPLWGLVVLVLHMRGEWRAAPPACALTVRPWLNSKPACALLSINCARLRNHTGTMAELDALFASIDASALAHIAIRDCPAIEMPRRLQTFSSLVGLKLYNSTLVRWGADAALTDAHHPRMVFVFLARVNMSTFPAGLASPQFPRQLFDIELSATNLTTIPDSLGAAWPVGDTTCGVFEQSALQNVPPVLATLQSAFVSLVGNNISELPSFLFTNAMATTLWLNDNPITQLPERLDPSRSIRAVRLANTQLQRLPVWMDARFFLHARLVAGNTPFCATLLAAVRRIESDSGDGSLSTTSFGTTTGSDRGDSDSSNRAVSDAAMAAFARGRINCDVVEGDDLTYYPLVAEAALAERQ